MICCLLRTAQTFSGRPWGSRHWILTAGLFLASVLPGMGAVEVVGASKDNSLYFDLSGAVSNGQGPTIFAGNNAGNSTRRALLAFDISTLPEDSLIQSVTLTLFLTQAQSFQTSVSLFRLTNNWGEGTSNAGSRGGAGTTASNGDATWVHTSRPGSLWTVPGGDFLPVASATATVANEGLFYVWNSTPQLVEDVQTWVDSPETNFGWILRGDESQGATAKAFASRETGDPLQRPSMTIVYSTVPEPGSITLLILAAFGVSAFHFQNYRRLFRRKYHFPPSANSLM